MGKRLGCRACVVFSQRKALSDLGLRGLECDSERTLTISYGGTRRRQQTIRSADLPDQPERVQNR